MSVTEDNKALVLRFIASHGGFPLFAPHVLATIMGVQPEN
jgi:hypothetical protein